MGRRRHGGVPVSFFSFQDIITTVTGILILVTLILALDMTTTVKRDAATDPAPKDNSATRLAETNAAIESATRRLRALSEALADLPQQSAGVEKAQHGDLAQSNLALTAQVAELEREANDAESRASAAISQLAREQDRQQQMQASLRSADTDIKALKDHGNVRLLPGAQGKTPILIEVHAKTASVGRAEANGELVLTQQIAEADLAAALTRLEQGADAERSYFVVYLRPDGVTLAARMIAMLEASRFDVGWDLLGEGQRLFKE